MKTLSKFQAYEEKQEILMSRSDYLKVKEKEQEQEGIKQRILKDKAKEANFHQEVVDKIQ